MLWAFVVIYYFLIKNIKLDKHPLKSGDYFLHLLNLWGLGWLNKPEWLSDCQEKNKIILLPFGPGMPQSHEDLKQLVEVICLAFICLKKKQNKSSSSALGKQLEL